jgi:hypothetical protein
MAEPITQRAEGANILHVGPGEAFGSLAAAVGASKDGDTIQIAAGTYVDDTVRVTHSVTIEGVGGRAHLEATHNIGNGKAIIVDAAEKLTIRNIEFSGGQVGEGNGAGIRYEKGDLVVQNSVFVGNQNGILSASIHDGHATIDGSYFLGNGAGDGQTHGAYFGKIASLVVTNSVFQDQLEGSALKSRADSTLVMGNVFSDSAHGTTNYQIDLPNGGTALVFGNIFGKSAEAGNRAFIHMGGEVADADGSLLVTHNSFTSDREPSVVVLNQSHAEVNLMNDSFSARVSIAVDGAGGVDLPLTGIAALPLSLLPLG